MIARLRGQIVEQNANQLILDVHGVGYLITVSSFTLKRIDREKGDISVSYTHLTLPTNREV